jgi:predicted enzyme related to lactoylglutathione lyase
MSESMPIGTIGWRDLTVPNAAEVKDFYCRVVGWDAEDHSMGDYNDFNIKSQDTGEVVAGICHARGTNAKIPPAWMIYIIVENVDRSAELCKELGGEVIDGPRDMGGSRFCIIKDPAGAVAGLYQS